MKRRFLHLCGAWRAELSAVQCLLACLTAAAHATRAGVTVMEIWQTAVKHHSHPLQTVALAAWSAVPTCLARPAHAHVTLVGPTVMVTLPMVAKPPSLPIQAAEDAESSAGRFLTVRAERVFVLTAGATVIVAVPMAAKHISTAT